MSHDPIVRLHALHEGFALCGLRGVPADWPDGHVWVSVAQAKSGEVFFDEEKWCPECKAIVYKEPTDA